jgi:hypothetical protein
MHSIESNASSPNRKPLVCDFELPVFEEPLIEPWPMKMSWEQAMRHFATTRDHYMRNFDSPKKRLREKNPAPFTLA